MSKEDLNEKILKQLKYFKFNRNSLGFEYLVQAIYIVSKDKTVVRDFNECVYPKIARRYHTEPKNVLWCINKIIGIMYLNTDEDEIREYFDLYYEDDKLSTKAFIMEIARNVNLNRDPKKRVKKEENEKLKISKKWSKNTCKSFY